MPSISIISFSPFERHHLLLCELDDTMFIVDCGWPTEDYSNIRPTDSKTCTAKNTVANPRDALSSINWARVDFVLISNYEQMTLLPYVTEYTEFAGPVYATEPTKAYGRCVLEEGLWSVSRSGSSLSDAHVGTSSSAGAEGRRVQQLPYTQQDIVASMERITDVRHNEIITPVPFVRVYTRSSGYCIGGANWTVEYKNHRTAFISTSSLATCLHPQEWDGSVLSEAQVVVFCDATDPAELDESDASSAPPNVHISQKINQLCSTATASLKQRNRVLLIGEPYGVTQDILQLVAENTISLNLPLPQFVIVSPIAERTLQYGNIMGEWLCAAKQALLYLPEYPFADKDLRQKGHLHFVRSLSQLATRNTPQGTWFVIVSPRDIATASHFVRQWQQDARQCSSADMAGGTGTSRFSVLIHDDDVARAQAIVNQISVDNEATYVPVSRRMTYGNIEQVLANAVRAQHVLVPSFIRARLPAATVNRFEFGLLEYSYLQATVIDLDTDRHLPLSIQREMTQQMKRDGKQHAIVSGKLSLSAGEIRLVRTDSSNDTSDNVDEGGLKSKSKSPNTRVQLNVTDQETAHKAAAVPAHYNLASWTPQRLASELCDVGLNAAVVGGYSESGGPAPGLVEVSVAGGMATIRMHCGWAVDCTSVSTQWAVLDALRRVLKST
ncbi:Integrator complex subunit 9 [Coemansia sp. RSA 988]|nr:Integrator complex subunit 9 [Coemansia sp. RSA 988]